MALVDVVVVSFNSEAYLRECVLPFAQSSDVDVVVVDNASTDSSVRTVEGLPVRVIERRVNGGFAIGCNEGLRAGSAPYVLFLNPDARLDDRSLRALVRELDEHRGTAVAAPRIESPAGELAWSQRRFPAVRSTYARALFLHRMLPRARWTDEVIRDPDAYRIRRSPDWVSGACLLVRREVLEAIGGWDERFFLYGEDIDLCRRIRDAGFDVRFVPSASAVHVGGASAPRSATLPLLAASRIRYVRKHRSRGVAIVDRLGLALAALTHVVVARGGRATRAGHARALGVALHPRFDRAYGSR